MNKTNSLSLKGKPNKGSAQGRSSDLNEIYIMCVCPFKLWIRLMRLSKTSRTASKRPQNWFCPIGGQQFCENDLKGSNLPKCFNTILVMGWNCYMVLKASLHGGQRLGICENGNLNSFVSKQLGIRSILIGSKWCRHFFGSIFHAELKFEKKMEHLGL